MTKDVEDKTEHSNSKKRDFSQQMMTRWYRAPEVIILDEYDEKIDNWSIGCTLAEMIRT